MIRLREVIIPKNELNYYIIEHKQSNCEELTTLLEEGFRVECTFKDSDEDQHFILTKNS